MKHIDTITEHWKITLALPTQDARRVFHGRGKCFPGLEHIVVDYYSPVLLIILFQETEESWLHQLCERLRNEAPPNTVSCIVLQRRYQTPTTTEVLWGEIPEAPVARENGLEYHLNFKAQNVGFFLDMRNARTWCQERVSGKKVLNLFAFTCAFSVVALQAGANQVVNVDMHRPSLSIGQRNHTRNQLDTRKANFLGHDIFKSWSKIKKLGPYDLIIIDPPMNQHKSFVTEKDYPRVIRRLPSLLSENGDILACLNSPHHDYTYLEELFLQEEPNWKPLSYIYPAPEYLDVNPNKGLKLIHFKQTNPI